MNTGERIKQLRLSYNMTLEELGNKIGVGKSTVRKWETGIIENLRRDKIEKLANVFGVSPNYIIGAEDEITTKLVKIPILGQVAAGKPIVAAEYIEGYEEIPEKLAKSGTFFALRVHGNSMSPKIEDGDIVIVEQADSADNDNIVIALVENNEFAVCKRLKYYTDSIALVSLNPDYEPMYFSKENPCKIIGKVIQLRRLL